MRYKPKFQNKANKFGLIMSVARDSIVAHGYRATSIANVASNAGMSKAGIYHYFSSKQDIFLEILNREGRSLLDFVDDNAEKYAGAPSNFISSANKSYKHGVFIFNVAAEMGGSSTPEEQAVEVQLKRIQSKLKDFPDNTLTLWMGASIMNQYGMSFDSKKLTLEQQNEVLSNES